MNDFLEKLLKWFATAHVELEAERERELPKDEHAAATVVGLLKLLGSLDDKGVTEAAGERLQGCDSKTFDLVTRIVRQAHELHVRGNCKTCRSYLDFLDRVTASEEWGMSKH